MCVESFASASPATAENVSGNLWPQTYVLSGLSREVRQNGDQFQNPDDIENMCGDFGENPTKFESGL